MKNWKVRKLWIPVATGSLVLQFAARSLHALVVPITFTGTTTLNPATATSTIGGITSSDVTFPETDTPTATDLADGFAISGRFDFLNGAGTSAELQFTATRPVTLTAIGLYTSSTIDGQFGIFSTDTGEISSNSMVNALAANLDSFSETTYLETTGGTPAAVLSSTATASDSNETIPVTPSFPTSAEHSLVGPVVNGPFIAPGDYLLVQAVDIKISGLLPGETVDIGLPTTSTIDTSVPEPASAGLMISALVAMGLRKRRNHRG
jgi:hypothetical protein